MKAIAQRVYGSAAVLEYIDVEMPVLGPDFHLFEAVADIRIAQFTQPHRLGIVGLDRDQRYAAAAIIVSQLLDAVFVKLRGWTVIAGKDDGQHFRGRIFRVAHALLRAASTFLSTPGWDIYKTRRRRRDESRRGTQEWVRHIA